MACPGRSVAVETVKVVTEEFPPYNYTDNGKVTGFATAVVEAVLREIHVEGRIQSMPWARAYDTAVNSEDVLIYSIGRTDARDKIFKWVGVIAPADWCLFSLPRRNLRLASLEMAKQYQTATVNQDVGEQFLAARGFAVGKNLQSSGKYAFNYEKLKLGRVDLWVANSFVAAYLARQAGDDPNKALTCSYHFADLGSEGLYMAFGAKTSDAYVDRFKSGLEAIRRKGVFDALQRKWL
jgi:polar amino acid transport system substrate-binding protein